MATASLRTIAALASVDVHGRVSTHEAAGMALVEVEGYGDAEELLLKKLGWSAEVLAMEFVDCRQMLLVGTVELVGFSICEGEVLTSLPFAFLSLALSTSMHFSNGTVVPYLPTALQFLILIFTRSADSSATRCLEALSGLLDLSPRLYSPTPLN